LSFVQKFAEMALVSSKRMHPGRPLKENPTPSNIFLVCRLRE
jgi:hypothetical protein